MLKKILHFQQCLMTLKRQNFEKIEYIVYWPRKNNLQIIIFLKSFLKTISRYCPFI
jgi:hypothetical protein